MVDVTQTNLNKQNGSKEKKKSSSEEESNKESCKKKNYSQNGKETPIIQIKNTPLLRGVFYLDYFIY